MEQPYITLNDGNRIPQFGLGVFMIFGNAKTKRVCLDALSLGYRHIDTAHVYGNERGVGAAVRKCGLPRDEIWVTSKLWTNEFGEGKTARAIDKMLKRIGLDYIDLLLLHRPNGDYIGAWKDMERAVAAGKVKSIGLSNFDKELDELLPTAKIMPSVIQSECHPYMQQDALAAKVASYGTVIESWYPIGHGDKELLGEPIFAELGKKYGKSAVQIILRWHIQKGYVVFPKTTNPQHLRDNTEIFDFSLTDEEMDKIKLLDRNASLFER